MKYIPANTGGGGILLWGCCCCGGLPFIGIILGLVMVVPFTIMLVISNTIIAIIHMFPELYYLYFTTIVTKKIGPNIKTLMVLTLWLPVLLYPLLTFISSVGVGIVVGLFGPSVATFSESGYCFWKTIYEVIKWLNFMIEWFWHKNHTDFFDTLEKHRGQYDGETFDIKLHKLPICLVMSLYGFFSCGLCCGALLLLKSPLILFRTYYYIWYAFTCCDIAIALLLFVPMLILNVLLPAIWAITIIALIIAGFFAGTYVFYPTYIENIMAGCKKTIVMIKRANSLMNDYLGFTNTSEASCLFRIC